MFEALSPNEAPFPFVARPDRVMAVLAAALATVLSAAPIAALEGASPDARLLPGDAVATLAAGPAEPDAEALLEAGLEFSGATAGRRASTAEYLRAGMDEAAALARDTPDAYELGGALLVLAHRRYFKRYVESATTLDAAVVDGRYNCVSSSLVYLILCRAAGLEAGGVVTEDHAFCRVAVPDGDGIRFVDVETTNVHGWDPGTNHEFQDSFGRVTGYSYVPPTALEGREHVGARRMASLVLSNRSNMLERAGRWAEAVGLAADAWAYCPDADNRELFIGRVHNNVAALVNARRWADAVAFLGRALDVLGNEPRLVDLMAQARLALLGDGLAAMPPAEAIEAVRVAWADGVIDEARRDEFLVYAYSKLADQVRVAGGWLAAWNALRDGVAAVPGSTRMAAMAETARRNWTYEVHNRFATLFNARRYAEALAVVEEGLDVLPAETLFLDDAAAARKALAGG